MTDLLSLPLIVIFLISLVLILAAIEAGRWLGQRHAEQKDENLATLEGAVLGLLALMISFTFAMALTRYDARRDAILNEANAIGTVALRARLLPAPHEAQSLALLRDYTQSRLEVGRASLSEAILREGMARAATIQEALWQQAKAVAAKDNAMVPTGQFIQSLNELIDIHETRVTALRTRVPSVVFFSLYAIAMVALGFTGYSASKNGGRSRIPAYVMGALIAGVILMIQDLDRPDSGFIKASQQPLRDTAESLATYGATYGK